MSDDARHCVVFWAYQGFRNEDRTMTQADIDTLVAQDPWVLTIGCLNAEHEWTPVYQRTEFPTHFPDGRPVSTLAGTESGTLNRIDHGKP